MSSKAETVEFHDTSVPMNDDENVQANESSQGFEAVQTYAHVGITSDQNRFARFLKADQGVHYSEVMRYSVTPETVANKISDRIKTIWPKRDDFEGIKTVIDLCGGAGGNTISFARAGFKTAYVDLSMENLQDAVHNSHVYNQYGIDFLCGDALKVDLRELAPDPASTTIFVSPEWGGPNYKLAKVFDTEICRPSVRECILRFRQQGFFKIAVYLPRNVNLDQLAYLGAFKIEYMRYYKSCLAVVAWFDERCAGSEPFLKSLDV